MPRSTARPTARSRRGLFIDGNPGRAALSRCLTRRPAGFGVAGPVSSRPLPVVCFGRLNSQSAESDHLKVRVQRTRHATKAHDGSPRSLPPGHACARWTCGHECRVRSTVEARAGAAVAEPPAHGLRRRASSSLAVETCAPATLGGTGFFVTRCFGPLTVFRSATGSTWAAMRRSSLQ